MQRPKDAYIALWQPSSDTSGKGWESEACEETCDWGWDLYGRFLLSNKGSHFYNFCCCRCLVAKSCLSLSLPPHELGVSIGFLCPWDLSGEHWSGLLFPIPGIFQPRRQNSISCLAGDSLPIETNFGSPCFTVTVVLKWTCGFMIS